MISASILRSESSSLSRCASIRRASRSCSPTLISSSNITPLSIPILYFDSRSSSEEVVLRACRSKSSFATSMSRSLRCNVRLESRRVVISFCRVFCAAFVSILACLYLVWRTVSIFAENRTVPLPSECREVADLPFLHLVAKFLYLGL